MAAGSDTAAATSRRVRVTSILLLFLLVLALAVISLSERLKGWSSRAY